MVSSEAGRYHQIGRTSIHCEVREQLANKCSQTRTTLCALIDSCGQLHLQLLANTGSQIDTTPFGAVVLISAPKGTAHAVYGGLMSHRARYLGALGTVIDGNLRDLDEHRTLNYTVGPTGPTAGNIS